ncbi:MAG: hypothetical protein JWN46_4036 [Acidimicrobiales bacterium]|nr:hypothetical protein [Acidimicrobiales bacterium]
MVDGVDDLTPAWCTAALAATSGAGRVSAVAKEPVGTGQVADTVRLTLDWEPGSHGPATVVVKVAAAAPESRSAARFTRTYEVEAGFYRDLAPSLPVRAPRCYYVDHEPDTDRYVVVLEDLAPARAGDQLVGCSPDEAAAAIDELAALHAPRWGDPALASIPWLHRHSDLSVELGVQVFGGLAPGFLERYGPELSPEASDLVERFIPRLRAYLGDRPGPWTVAHGDFRADNLLFGGDRVAVVDWQTVAHGPAEADVAYFLGGSVTTDVRRAHERDLVAAYGVALRGRGVDVAADDLWAGYRRHAFSGLLMAILASMIVARTERGDQMFLAMAERAAAHALDLDSESFLAGPSR